MRSDLLSQDRPGEFSYKCLRMVNTPLVQNRGKNMKESIKSLTIEELMQIVKLAQKEIDRRTIKKVDDRN